MNAVLHCVSALLAGCDRPAGRASVVHPGDSAVLYHQIDDTIVSGSRGKGASEARSRSCEGGNCRTAVARTVGPHFGSTLCTFACGGSHTFKDLLFIKADHFVLSILGD